MIDRPQAHRWVKTSQTDDLQWVRRCLIILWLENRISDDEHSKARRSLTAYSQQKIWRVNIMHKLRYRHPDEQQWQVLGVFQNPEHAKHQEKMLKDMGLETEWQDCTQEDHLP